jgi:hypothetical protein
MLSLVTNSAHKCCHSVPPLGRCRLTRALLQLWERQAEFICILVQIAELLLADVLGHQGQLQAAIVSPDSTARLPADGR